MNKQHMENESLEAPVIQSPGHGSRGFLLCAAVMFTLLVLQWLLNSGRLAMILPVTMA
jgi:hypothetical protein